VMAKAFSAGFHRFIQRWAGLPLEPWRVADG
jgi:hypothetical protein